MLKCKIKIDYSYAGLKVREVEKYYTSLCNLFCVKAESFLQI